MRLRRATRLSLLVPMAIFMRAVRDFGRASTFLHEEPRDGDGAEHRRNCYAAVYPENALNVVIIEAPSRQQMPGLGGAGDALSARGGDEGHHS